jgi:hypothetical protein
MRVPLGHRVANPPPQEVLIKLEHCSAITGPRAAYANDHSRGALAIRRQSLALNAPAAIRRLSGI